MAVVGKTVRVERTDRFHVEIRHPGGEWVHIHTPEWEMTSDHDQARAYAERVARDHPVSDVRMVQNRSVKITAFSDGESTTVDLSPIVHDM